MFLNVPVIGFRDDAYYKGKNVDLFPMLSAKTTQEIADQLTNFSDKVIDTNAMATNAKAWLFYFNLTQFKQNIETAFANKREKKLSTLSILNLRLLPLKLNFFKYCNIVKINTSIK
jgi:hypothetical protein